MLYRVIKYGVCAIVLVFTIGAYAAGDEKGGGGGGRPVCFMKCTLPEADNPEPIVDVVEQENCGEFCSVSQQTCIASAAGRTFSFECGSGTIFGGGGSGSQ